MPVTRPGGPVRQEPIDSGADDRSRNFSDLIRIVEQDPGYRALKQQGASDDQLTARMQQVLRAAGEIDGVIRATGVRNGELVTTGGIPWKTLAVSFGALATAGVIAALAGGAGAAGAAGATGATGATGAAGGALPFASTIPVQAAPGALSLGGGAAAGTAATAGGVLGKVSGFLTNPLFSAGAQAAGAFAKGRAEGRLAESNQAFSEDAENRARQGATIQTAGYNAQRYDQLVNAAIRGNLMKNLTDVKLTPPPGVNMGTVTGGLRPSSITNLAERGSDLENRATLELLRSKIPGLVADLPARVPQPKSTWLDKALGVADIVGAGVDTWRDLSRPKTSPGMPANPYLVRNAGVSFLDDAAAVRPPSLIRSRPRLLPGLRESSFLR